jgi:hypothetical protein
MGGPEGNKDCAETYRILLNMEQNRKKTSQGEVWKDNEGILHQEYKPGAELRLEDSLDELRIYLP